MFAKMRSGIFKPPSGPLVSDDGHAQQSTSPAGRGVRFWLAFIALAIAALLAAVETTIISSALPTIARDLGAGENYVWFVNAFMLTMTSLQPLYGQLSQVFGCRPSIMAAMAAFLIGSFICGWAPTTGALVAGRAVQGAGSAGISVLSQLIVSHLVSVRERSKFLAIILAMFGVGASVGPVLGGVLVQRASWRWVFWLNLPIGGITLGLLHFFLRGTAAAGRLPLLEKLKAIDWAGNVLLTGSCVAVLLALSWARTRYPWSSWKVILPAVVGLVGQAGFCVFEGSKYCRHPMMPPRVFANRTSGAAMAFTFFQTMLQGSRIYFLPVYFQGVRLASPETSGLLMLPSVVVGPPSAIIAGYAVSRCGRYKPIHLAGLGLAAVGAGLFTRLVRSTTMVEVVMSQIVISCGAGMLPNTVLPAIQASLPQADLVACTSAFSFLRSYGNVWAVPISSFIFSSWFSAHSSKIDAYANISAGSAYAHASARFIKSLPGDVGSQLTTLYADSLRLLWEVSLGISIACFLTALLERELPMATTATPETQLTDSQTPPRPPETR